jgi:choline-glycine betaine transporter
MSTELIDQSDPPSPDLKIVGIGVAAVVAVVAWAALGEDSFDSASSTALSWVLDNFAWLFVIAADVFLVLCVVIAMSRFAGSGSAPTTRNPSSRTSPGSP